MAVNSLIQLVIDATATTTADFTTVSAPIAKRYSTKLDSGTSANQADLLYHKHRTVAGATDDPLDLAGVLTNTFGLTLTMVEVVAIAIHAYAANPDTITIGAAGSHPFAGFFGDAASDTISLAPGGDFYISNPNNPAWTVGAGASDVLNVLNDHATLAADYDIFVWGRSA